MRKALSLFFAFAILWLSAAPISAESPEDILVIANRALKAKSISDSELRDIFLKKKESWHTGLRALPVHSKNAQLRNDFSQRLLQMNPSEEMRYWQQYQIKTGKPQPPSFGNTLKAVFSLKGAVSYIYRSQYREGVANVVLVLPQ